MRTFHQDPETHDDDTIHGITDGNLGLTWLADLSAEAASVPGLNAVWLSAHACLVQSHLPAPEEEPLVIQVVGIVDSGDWSGAVLMLQ